ncbi:MAG TPA: pyridoxamine 5'-phosphate oxidase family protein [Candidatus Kapabacteria bacterium]|nr:pyridoxamine 5'-phosphate oxidase family protein [Candidatus Kapabacteria bacterium]
MADRSSDHHIGGHGDSGGSSVLSGPAPDEPGASEPASALAQGYFKVRPEPRDYGRAARRVRWGAPWATFLMPLVFQHCFGETGPVGRGFTIFPERHTPAGAVRVPNLDARCSMTRDQLLHFMQAHRLAVQTSVSQTGVPQAAVVGIAVTDRLEIVFDTLATSRKAYNLRGNPAIALVIGGTAGGEERTVQFEGVADEPEGAERDRLVGAYLQVYPDGTDRQAWPGLIYIRVRPTWIRYSDFSSNPPLIVEFTGSRLLHPD